MGPGDADGCRHPQSAIEAEDTPHPAPLEFDSICDGESLSFTTIRDLLDLCCRPNNRDLPDN